jgi:hypothetical protein
MSNFSVIDLSADPAYAAIRQYRAAMSAFNDYDGPYDDERRDELEDAYHAARLRYWAVVPTTIGGFNAKIAMLLAGNDLDGIPKNWMVQFFDTLCKSARIIVGQPPEEDQQS